MKDIDRIEFYEQLSKCQSRKDVEDLIEIIEDDELQIAIQDKLEQILEINKDEDVKSIVRILEYTYFKFRDSHNREKQ